MSNTEYKPMEELEVYRRFEDIGDEIWELVVTWDDFAKRTVGRQLVCAVDSIGANLMEGDGRSTTRDSLHFSYIARGSCKETVHFLRRAKKRRLLEIELAERPIKDVSGATQLLNRLITYRKSRLMQTNVIREEAALYGYSGPSLDLGSSSILSPEHLNT